MESYFEQTLKRLIKAQAALHEAVRCYNMAVGKTDVDLKSDLEGAEGRKLTRYSHFSELFDRINDKDTLTDTKSRLLMHFKQNPVDINLVLGHPVFNGYESWGEDAQDQEKVLFAFSFVIAAVIHFKNERNERLDIGVQRLLFTAGCHIGRLTALGAEKSDARGRSGSHTKKGAPTEKQYQEAAKELLAVLLKNKPPDNPKITQQDIAKRLPEYMTKLYGFSNFHSVTQIAKKISGIRE